LLEFTSGNNNVKFYYQCCIIYDKIQSYIDSGYCSKLVDKRRTVNESVETNMDLIQFAIFYQSRLSWEAICDVLRTKK